jgi:hypothetical protein
MPGTPDRAKAGGGVRFHRLIEFDAIHFHIIPRTMFSYH